MSDTGNNKIRKGTPYYGPLITFQPQSRTAQAGSTTTLTVTATGTPAPGFEWLVNGAVLEADPRVSGAQGNSLTIAGVVPGDAGAYQVVVSNSLGSATSTAAILSVTAGLYVPGTSDPWLAGMPNGSVSGWSAEYDLAPSESPVQARGFPIAAGRVFTFAASGAENNQPGVLYGPDGNRAVIVSHYPGAENGMSSLTAPIDALLGVFLDDNTPSHYTAPVALNFTPPASRDFLALHPLLRQPFFIGDGLTSQGYVQQFVAPTGATRLFFGPMDAYQWAGNPGGFTVQIAVHSALSVPPTIAASPSNQVVATGQEALLTLAAHGTPPLSYQWLFSGTNLAESSRIVGSRTTTLVITNATPGDSGAYRAVVTNLYGAAMTTEATLTVGSPPRISSQPQSLAVQFGADATFSVSVSPDSLAPLAYQWQMSGANLPGATQSFQGIFRAQSANAGAYQVVVSNPIGSVTSAVARLTVSTLAIARLVHFVSARNYRIHQVFAVHANDRREGVNFGELMEETRVDRVFW